MLLMCLLQFYFLMGSDCYYIIFVVSFHVIDASVNCKSNEMNGRSLLLLPSFLHYYVCIDQAFIVCTHLFL